jgi:hypothetical protein
VARVLNLAVLFAWRHLHALIQHLVQHVQQLIELALAIRRLARLALIARLQPLLTLVRQWSLIAQCVEITAYHLLM